MKEDFFDESGESLINLDIFYGPKQNIIKKCLVLFSENIKNYLLDNFKCEQISALKACNGAIPIYSVDYEGEKIGFFLSPLGAALAGTTVIEVSHMTGAKTFVMFGSCGSLDNNVTSGKFVIPTESYRGEGMSFYFAKPENYIKIKNSDKLASIFKKLNIPFVQGKNWTIECMLSETKNLVKARKEEGCISVEMELSGVQAVCDYHGFELYNFLAAGDVVLENSYDIKDLRDANSNCDKLEIALRLIPYI